MLETGQRIRLASGQPLLTVELCVRSSHGWKLALKDDNEAVSIHDLSVAEFQSLERLDPDGSAKPRLLLAGLWCQWMRAATGTATATTLATSPLRPYAHQTVAVYGRMLPQPCLRFLLADEPGTGKTIMAGLYLREMQRLGFVTRALVVAPAHLVTKWQADFERFFGGGLKRITNSTIQEGGLHAPHDLWIVSLELAAQNPKVQDAITPELAGWDAVVFDEAHRMTLSAKGFWSVGKRLASKTPRALLMTATPHRGKDDLFRGLMHLVDPDVYPEPVLGESVPSSLKPGRLHFLRRMKEDLFDHDGQTPLFKGRQASNEAIPLNTIEAGFYNEAQDFVTRYFPSNALTLARMVYGKRAASSLFALQETLKRRLRVLNHESPLDDILADPNDQDPESKEEEEVNALPSMASSAEKEELKGFIARLEATLSDEKYLSSKWPRLLAACLTPNGIEAENGEQGVIFTEFADSAKWLVSVFHQAGFSAELYWGGISHPQRDEIRRRFAAREFQILVSTDAGNEGIDLQTAHVLVNWDIPWSLVRLEQRMGRIHRVGQTRDVQLYNLIALGTREGEVVQVLLQNFVIAANELDGKVFDSLSVVEEKLNLGWSDLLKQTFVSGEKAALAKARKFKPEAIEKAFSQTAGEENSFKSPVDTLEALDQWREETLERINPRIIEAFLRRLQGAGLCVLTPHVLGEGIFRLSKTAETSFPASFGASSEAVIATSGLALAASHASFSTTPVIPLGPSEAPFRELVGEMGSLLRPALFQGGALRDASSATAYNLFVYEMTRTELGLGAKQRRTVWPLLVRCDATGARLVPWELLANLEAVAEVTASPPTKEESADAQARAELERTARTEKHQKAREIWLQSAKKDLDRLVHDQTLKIPNSEVRIATRKRLEAATKERLEKLRAMTELEISPPKALGWAQIAAGQGPPEPTEADSEWIAMNFVSNLLHHEGWAVADVHLEGRGYDLLATRGAAQRCVEVKGVWKAASAAGVVLTGNEILKAQQLGQDYILIVVDFCENGTGTLFGRYPAPADLFHDLMKDVTLFKVPGSALKAARGKGLVMRMIERWFPCEEVSQASAKGWGSGNSEKSLFTWFAARPLAQARAAVLTSLLPWPDTEKEQERLKGLVQRAMSGRDDAHDEVVRELKKHYPEGAKAADIFSGRGIIPLEMARYGVKAWGLDYSPVATLAGQLLADYPARDWDNEPPLPFGKLKLLPDAKHPPRLVGDVEAVLAEVGRRFREKMSPFYPINEKGTQPWGYLWAITLPCQNCGHRFPMTGTLELRRPTPKDQGQSYRIWADRATGCYEITVHEGPPTGTPTRVVAQGKNKFDSSGKVAVCPFCEHVHPKEVHTRLMVEGQGQDVILVAADIEGRGGKVFREPTEAELDAARRAEAALKNEAPFPNGLRAIPDERIPPGNTWTIQPLVYGAQTFGDLCTPRQTLGFVHLCRAINEVGDNLFETGFSHDYTAALCGYAASAVVRKMKRSTRGATLGASRQGVDHIFSSSESSISFSYDFFEVGLGDGPGGWDSLCRDTLRAVENQCQAVISASATLRRVSATALPFENYSLSAVVCDPPYDEMVEYADASDLFYVWLKRALATTHPDLAFTLDPQGNQEKVDEIIVKKGGGRSSSEHRDRANYDRLLAQAFREAQRVTRRDGVVSIVFGHGDPEVWQRLLDVISAAELVLTGSWPAQTESGGQAGSANIRTTLTLACRPAEANRPVGRVNEVTEEVKNEVVKRAKIWDTWNLALTDQLMASAGPAMEVVGRYSQILDRKGEAAELRKFLIIARRAVQEAAGLIVEGLPLETFDTRTRFALFWTRVRKRELTAKSEARWEALASDLKLEDLKGILIEPNKGKDKGMRLVFSHETARLIDENSATIDVAFALARAWNESLDAAAEVLARAGRDNDDAYLWGAMSYLTLHLPDGDADKRAWESLKRSRSNIIEAAKGEVRARSLKKGFVHPDQLHMEFSV